MGKRKSSSKPQGPKKKESLPTQFTCLFCNHEKSVHVKIDKKAGVGQLDCKMCGQKFQCGVNYLSAAVDVYGEWVDAAESVANGNSNPQPGYLGTSKPSGSRRLTSRAAADDDDEDSRRYEGDGIVDDDDDAY